MSAEIVKRFVGGHTGTERYSIRKHPNGAFQIFHDNPFEGIPQRHEHDDKSVSGLFADIESAEAELLRLGVL